ncbi:MAG: transglycosylase domain-containing protein, partial [Kangiellaceae bacterium]|nr:transglycosylase domain-containing protein [Kangiellaceae bacterium]
MKRLSRFAPTLLYFTSLFLLLFAMGFVGLYLSVGPGLPEVESIRKIRLQTPMRVYSKDEQLIAEFGDTRRIPITLDQVPRDFINALLSTEDQRFYEHSGVDLLGVLRAFINLAATGTKSQGASTITMLVARNYYLTREKRFSRKFTEMFLAWKIESELSKNEILELFLNKIHFSHRAYGLGAAAQVYYGKSLASLSLPQLATLAGIPKGESMYNPISNPKNALKRRTHVLGRMLAEGHITQQLYEEANNAPIETHKHGMQIAVDAPYLAEMVRQYAIEQFGIDAAYNDGIKIYTTLDANLQQYAHDALKLGLEEYDQRHGYRGAEHQYAVSEETSIDQLEDWISDVPAVAGLNPAIVAQLEDEKASIVVKGIGRAEILLKDLKWARKYIDENHVDRKKIKVSSDVLSLGDLIRVTPLRQTNEESGLPLFKLSQIPEVSGGFVSLNPQNGAIEALVGDYDY